MPPKLRVNDPPEETALDLVAMNDRLTQYTREIHLSQQARDDNIQAQFQDQANQINSFRTELREFTGLIRTMVLEKSEDNGPHSNRAHRTDRVHRDRDGTT